MCLTALVCNQPTSQTTCLAPLQLLSPLRLLSPLHVAAKAVDPLTAATTKRTTRRIRLWLLPVLLPLQSTHHGGRSLQLPLSIKTPRCCCATNDVGCIKSRLQCAEQRGRASALGAGRPLLLCTRQHAIYQQRIDNLVGSIMSYQLLLLHYCVHHSEC